MRRHHHRVQLFLDNLLVYLACTLMQTRVRIFLPPSVEMVWNYLLQVASKNVIGIYLPENQRLTGNKLNLQIFLNG